MGEQLKDYIPQPQRMTARLQRGRFECFFLYYTHALSWLSPVKEERPSNATLECGYSADDGGEGLLARNACPLELP